MNIKEKEVIELYKKGMSIDYIIKKFYTPLYRKIINSENNKCLVICCGDNKNKIKNDIYNTIYKFQIEENNNRVI